jgi:hypothetical protein
VADAEGPATVTPHTDSCRGPRGLNACDCGAEQRAVGPATVTLTDDELEPLRVALMVAYASQPMGYDRAKRATDRTVAEVVAPFAARVAALTADLATARAKRDEWREDYATATGMLVRERDATRAERDEAYRVIANVRALADEWINDSRYDITYGAGERLRALLPAAPTWEEGTDG